MILISQIINTMTLSKYYSRLTGLMCLIAFYSVLITIIAICMLVFSSLTYEQFIVFSYLAIAAGLISTLFIFLSEYMYRVTTEYEEIQYNLEQLHQVSTKITNEVGSMKASQWETKTSKASFNSIQTIVSDKL